MVKGNAKVLISLVLALSITPYAFANEVEGTRVVAGDLKQNEFYILAKDQAQPVTAKPALKRERIHVATTTTKPTLKPERIHVATTTKQQPAKKLLKSNHAPVTARQIANALNAAQKQKKQFAAKKPERVIVLKANTKKSLQANNNKTKHHVTKTPLMLHTLADVKRLEAQMAQAMPHYQPPKRIKSLQKPGYKEVASYDIYDGERRKVISYEQVTTPKKIAVAKTKTQRFALQSKKLKPTISLND